jgi:DNA-binding response OmpR family regulator
MPILKTPFALAIHENGSIRGLIHSILKHAGYAVLAVTTENEAARLLQAGYAGIRLLIMDQEKASWLPALLPAQTGIDGCDGVKVLFLTPVRSLAERVSDALKHPESGFLAKPFSPKDLLNLVDALIGPPRDSHEESWSAVRGNAAIS